MIGGLTSAAAAATQGMIAPVRKPTCYQLFNALGRGWRAPSTVFVIMPLDDFPSYRVMPVSILRKVQDKDVKHDSLKERIKGLKRRLRGNPFDATARSNLERYETELAARRSGKPTKGFAL